MTLNSSPTIQTSHTPQLEVYDPVVEAQRFYRFIREVILPSEHFKFDEWSQFHKELIYRSCLEIAAVAAPRGSTKSTIVSRYRPLYLLCTYPHCDILSISESSSLAKDHLYWIQTQLLSNPILQQRYPNLAAPNSLPWNETELELTNGARMRAYGYASRIRGRHPSHIFFDDMESETNMGTEEALKKFKSWFMRVLMPMRNPDTHIMGVGTIIAQNSLLTDLIDNPEWNGHLYKALITNPDGTHDSMWPQRWSVEYLLKLRRLLGTHAFNAEFQNAPLATGDCIVLPEWIAHHSPNDLATSTPTAIYIGVDPAFTEERWGDYSAIIVLEEHNSKLYQTVAWRKKVGLPALRDTLISFYNSYHHLAPTHMVIEEVAAQKAVRQSILDLDPTIPIIGIKPDGDKRRRLISVSRYFEMGLISLSSQRLTDELEIFPSGPRDSVDALVYALKCYEQHRPVHLNSQALELDILSHLDDTSLAVYMERASQHFPLHMTSKRNNEFEDAQAMMEELEEFGL